MLLRMMTKQERKTKENKSFKRTGFLLTLQQSSSAGGCCLGNWLHPLHTPKSSWGVGNVGVASSPTLCNPLPFLFLPGIQSDSALLRLLLLCLLLLVALKFKEQSVLTNVPVSNGPLETDLGAVSRAVKEITDISLSLQLLWQTCK